MSNAKKKKSFWNVAQQVNGTQEDQTTDEKINL
jgi:hypothetical protein